MTGETETRDEKARVMGTRTDILTMRRERGAAPAIRPTPVRRGLKTAIACRGVGLHGGLEVEMRLVPAAVGSGIWFHRTDVGASIEARYDHVCDTRLSTILADPARPSVRVGTIEHLMAALAGLGIDDVLVEVDGPELPILDGSSAEFVFLLSCAGIVETAIEREFVEILRPVRIVDGAAFAELHPADMAADGFEMALEIDFSERAIGRQSLALDVTPESFARSLARARTFTMKSEIDALHEAGLAQGGSLANAVVVEDEVVLNPEGLRFADEFVRHKMLDAVGDLALAGAPIRGRFIGSRSGHRLNNLLLRAVFADRANFQRVGVAEPALAAVA